MVKLFTIKSADGNGSVAENWPPLLVLLTDTAREFAQFIAGSGGPSGAFAAAWYDLTGIPIA
ncbi:MAG: hypothetical protein HC900_00220 [Methylacidiphilales bacterium]|nr:hypothetical protein [Candidatus Methylacidiphilales bacterium]